MRIDVRRESPPYGSYRAARVRSLFNADDSSFAIAADLDIDDADWRIGVVVGPSGSGKTTIGRELWAGAAFYDHAGWPDDAPIVEAIAPAGTFDDVTAALAQAGLGEVRAWLRPYAALSAGQRFRADLARILVERPGRIVIDEFTSVVDRQIAKVGAGAFAKAWRRPPGGQAVLLTPHYDVLDWLEPDWVFDTGSGHFARGSLQYRRPRLEIEIRRGGWGLWPVFKPYHYLDLGPMPAAKVYAAFIEGEPVAHLGVGTRPVGKGLEARGCRLVVMPEWQGAGIGTRFLNAVCEMQLTGAGVLPRPLTTIFHTSHPQLCAALRRDPRWRQVSAALYGGNKAKSAATMRRSGSSVTVGYGGHFRAVQGFRYVGAAA